MVNPAAVAWNSSVSATVVWNKERLRQRINNVRGIITLDLQDCGLTEIPDEMYTLDELPNINVLELSGNFIRTLPKRLSCMKLLRQLKLSYNEVREIETGALSKQLEALSLEHNRIKCLPANISSCSQLRFLNLAWNDLEQLPPALPALEVLDVNGNNTLGVHCTLEAAESDTSSLDHKAGFDMLTVFYAHWCAYTKIPESIIASQRVKCINMTNNKLQALSPDTGLMSELNELSLDGNCITELPTELVSCHALRWISLQNNPLKIPREVISQGIKAIMNYLNASENASVINMRFRVPLLGDTGAGKSSFVDSLITGKSQLKHENDRTYVVEHKEWRPESKRYPGEVLQIQFDDFGGHECYKQVHIFFLSRKCTPVICVRVDKLNEDTFNDVVTPWLDTTTSTIPNATFHVLITHTDRLPDKNALETKLQMMLERITRHEESVKEQIQKEITTVEKDIKTCTDNAAIQAMYEEKATLEKFLSQRPEVPNKIHAVSSYKIQSVQEAGQEILNVFEDVKKCPEEKVPKVWRILQKKVKDKPGVARYLPWATVCQLGEECNLNEEEVSYAMKYLHLCGDVLWYDDGPMLKDIVFHDPNKLVELIKTLITHDIKDIRKDQEQFNQLTSDEFTTEKERMLTKGLISMKLLGCLWFDFRLKDDEIDFLKELLLRFDLCFAIPRGDNIFDAKQAVDLMFPWLLPEKRPHVSLDEKPRSDERQIGIKMCFTGLCPASFFPALSVRLNKFVNNQGERQHWSNGVCGEDESGNIFLLEYMRTHGRDIVLLKVRGTELGAMWHLALPIQREMQDLLRKWPGLVSTFYVPCPRCPLDKAKPCDFTAEYLWKPHPGQPRPRCPITMQHVDLLLLYPSKEDGSASILTPFGSVHTAFSIADFGSMKVVDLKKELIKRGADLIANLDGFHPPSKPVYVGTGHTQYQSLCILLNGYGAEMLREMLQAAIQPMNLDQWLLSYQPYVHRILKNSPLKTYGRLYPGAAQVVEVYDLSCDLLLDLLCGGQLQGVGQNKATIHDFKRIYEEVNNTVTKPISDSKFEQLWKEAETAIVQLGGNKEKIDEIKRSGTTVLGRG